MTPRASSEAVARFVCIFQLPPTKGLRWAMGGESKRGSARGAACRMRAGWYPVRGGRDGGSDRSFSAGKHVSATGTNGAGYDVVIAGGGPAGTTAATLL